MLILMFVLTIIAVLGVVYLVGFLWAVLFAAALPNVVSGLIGGLSALPIWEGLKRIKRDEPKKLSKQSD